MAISYLAVLIVLGLIGYFVWQLKSKKPDSDRQKEVTKNLICCLVCSAVMVILAQIMIDTGIFSMGIRNFLWGVLIVFAVILFIYCIVGEIISSVFAGGAVFMFMSTINAYVFRFRSRLFEPTDVFSVGTALNVADNYSLLPIPAGLIIGWGLFVVMMVGLGCLRQKKTSGLTLKNRGIFLAVTLAVAGAIFVYTAGIHPHHWHKAGAEYNGYFLDFVSKIKEATVQKPKGYDIKQVENVGKRYETEEKEPEHTKKPNIIIIMDEAFADLNILGEFSTNKEVTPFISSLKENTVSGYALASVYGGNTANSEYEVLTGNSMAWMSPNVVPYQQYLRSSTYSMVGHLKSEYDYKCVAMHPFNSGGWNRPDAYRYMGFDECFFVEDFPQKDKIRGYISDQEMFDFLIETYENKNDEPMFIFGVTMQNHGGYTYTGNDYTHHITIDEYGSEYPDVEQYLSLIHETDKATENLITYFEQADEDVVILFFGDHQPKIDESFYETIGNPGTESLDDRQQRYKVPFFIWANYDIEENYIDCTSLNYLSSYVYDVAGIELPPYNKFLREMEEIIPSINANGFYSVSAGKFMKFDEADETEIEWLNLYKMLKYNSIASKKNRNVVLFPPQD